MWQLVHYLFYGAFLHPTVESICRAGEICPINWNTSTNGNLELELEINNTWSSLVDEEHRFLSIIIDESTQNYDWQVPWYLTTFWKNPKRLVLTDLVTKDKTYSDEFLVPGISFKNDISPSLYPTQLQRIEWETNEPNNSLFAMNLEGTIDYGEVVPYSLTNNETFDWNVSNFPDSNVRLKLISGNVKTYTYSNTFIILEITTTTTTITTTTTTLNVTKDETENDRNYIWLFLILIGALILLTLVMIVIYNYFKKSTILKSKIAMGIRGGKSVRPSDSNERMRHAYQNQIYDESISTNQNNIYDTPPALPRPIVGNGYNRLTKNEYNQLMKQQNLNIINNREASTRNPIYFRADTINCNNITSHSQVRVQSPVHHISSSSMRRTSSSSSSCGQHLYHYPSSQSTNSKSENSSSVSSSISTPIPKYAFNSEVATGPVLI